LYYIVYENVEQMQTSAPVLVNGLVVGAVRDIYLKPDDYTKIIVEIEVNKIIKVPKNAIAQILTTSIMGGKAVNLFFENVCDGDDCAKNGDYLTGETKGLLDSMVGVDKVDDYMTALQKGVDRMMDSLSYSLKNKDNEVGKSLRDVQATLVHLRATSANLDQLLATSKGNITQTLDHLEAITATIRTSNDAIKTIFANTEAFSGQLKDMDLKGTTAEAKAAIANLKTTLATTDKTLAEVSGLIQKVRAGEGTLGKLLNDKTLYDNLNTTSHNLDLLLQDVRLNPKRYTRILSRKQIPYQAPVNDPVKEKN
jgi:phospholipid/cholesterol/gamma-HCH transport system substrate-binding protein